MSVSASRRGRRPRPPAPNDRDPATKPSRRRRGFRAIGEIADPVVRDVCGRFGFRHIRILRNWKEIVGTEVATRCRPVRIATRSGRATLYVRADGAHATEVQHLVPQMLRRVEAVCGERAVDEVRVTQVAGRQPVAPQPRRGPVRPPTVEERAEVARIVADVRDPRLRAALEGLGIAMRVGDAGNAPPPQGTAC